jgi:hypothetical protein
MPDAGEKSPTNIGTAGVGVFKSLLNSLFQFKKINVGSSRLTILDDTGNNEVDLDLATTLAGMTFTTPTINGQIDAQVAKTGNYTLTATDKIIRADASGGAFTLTLPAASGIAGTTYVIIRTDIGSSTNLLTIDANASETIDGLLTWKLLPGEKISIMSDGTNWITLYRDGPSMHGYYFDKGSTDNRRYPAGMSAGSRTGVTSTTSPVTGTLWALPFFVGKVTKFDLISFDVTTLIAAKNARCGIYFDKGNMYPGALIFDTGSVSVATTGLKDTTITASLQTFQPGLYWLAWETDSTATLQIRTIASQVDSVLSPLGLSNSWGTAIGYGYSVAHTYGALPDPYTAGATILTTAPAATNPVPLITLRAI